MEMPGKDRNIRGICPELHFFRFFQTMLSPIPIEEIHPSREESHRIEPGVHFPSVAASGTNRGWGERAMQISGRTTVSSQGDQWPNHAPQRPLSHCHSSGNARPKLSQ
jgi:hypothetical protein